jgi:hypothetical protein
MKPTRTIETSDGMVVDWGGGMQVTFKTWEEVPPAYSQLREQARRETTVYAATAVIKGRHAWAAWQSLTDCEAGVDPVAHGGEADRATALAKAKAAALEARQPNTVAPWQVENKHVERWRRKEAMRKRLEHPSDAQQAQPVAYLYHHHWDIDLDTLGSPASAWPGWARGLPLPWAWHTCAHRITKRTATRIFAMRQCGMNASGQDVGGVPVVEYIALDRVRLEHGGIQERWFLGRYVQFSLSRQPSQGEGVSNPNGGISTPPCIAALGLGWPCDLADVKAAFRRPSHEVHPDKGGSAEAFQRLRRTYEEALALVPTADTQRVR